MEKVIEMEMILEEEGGKKAELKIILELEERLYEKLLKRIPEKKDA